MENATNFTDSFNSTNGTDGNGTFTGFTPPPKPFWSGLPLTISYLTILLGSLYAFSSLYRKRQLARQASLEPWFPRHLSRDIYHSLLHMDPEEASAGNGEKKLKNVPDSVLKAALMQRALEDIQRILQLRTSKQALQTLVQRGSIGDDLWQRFQRAEQEMEDEVKDVASEANAYSAGWGQVIFQSANEMNQNIMIRERTAEILAGLEAEKEWWDAKKAGIQSEFMKELDEDAAESKTEDIVAAPKKTGSDDDAVLVEAGGPGTPQGGGAGGKKKKGKK